MALEIEWKFLVTRIDRLPDTPGESIAQGYLNDGDPTVRVRTKGAKAFLTIKGDAGSSQTGPSARHEFEYEIPVQDARELLAMAKWTLSKTRVLLPGGIELDLFEGRHAGLVLAEAEVAAGDPPPQCPAGWEWIDVSHDRRYTNRALAEKGQPPDCPLAARGRWPKSGNGEFFTPR